MPVNPNLVDDLAEQVMYAGEPGAAEQSSFFMDVMDTIPGIGVAAAIKTSRGGSTLIHGGRADRAGTAARFLDLGADKSRAGLFKGGLSNLYYRPGNLRTVATRGYFGMSPQAGATQYNPFWSSSVANVIPRAITGKGGANWFNTLLGGNRPGAEKRLAGFVDEDTGEMFSRGFASRVSASARIGAMSQARFAGSADDILYGLRGMYSEVGSGLQFSKFSQTTASQLTGVSGAGPLSARMGSWINASQAHITGDTFRVLLETQKAGGRGSRAAGAALEAGKRANRARSVAGVGTGKVGVFDSLARAAQYAGKGSGAAAGANLKLASAAAARISSRFIPYVGWGLLAYDVGKFTGKTAARTVSTGFAAVGSYTAPMRTGIMQQAFTDNEVTRTSRARGVQMIQNSRLNARSVLGNEAASMAAYF